MSSSLPASSIQRDQWVQMRWTTAISFYLAWITCINHPAGSALPRSSRCIHRAAHWCPISVSHQGRFPPNNGEEAADVCLSTLGFLNQLYYFNSNSKSAMCLNVKTFQERLIRSLIPFRAAMAPGPPFICQGWKTVKNKYQAKSFTVIKPKYSPCTSCIMDTMYKVKYPEVDIKLQTFAGRSFTVHHFGLDIWSVHILLKMKQIF